MVNATPRPLYPRERDQLPIVEEGRVGPRDGLGGCGKRRLGRTSIPGPSSPQHVAIPIELSRPITVTVTPDAPYCNPGPVQLCKIFSHNIIDGAI